MKAWNSEFDKRFERNRRLINWYIGFVAVFCLGIAVCIGVLTYKVASAASAQDWSNGLKPVIEQLWCGKPGCLGS